MYTGSASRHTLEIEDTKPKSRKAYQSDVSDAGWEFCGPYLLLMKEEAPQRSHPLREMFNALRYIVRCGCQWRMMANDLRELSRLAKGKKAQPTAAILNGRTLQSSPESGARAGYDGYKRRNGSKVHIAVDSLGHLLALRVVAASEQERAQVAGMAALIQEATGDQVELAYVDQGYTGEQAARGYQGTQHPPGGGETPGGDGMCPTCYVE